MKVLRTISRKDLIEVYLRREDRDKHKAIPSGRDGLDWDNPNEIDGWLREHGYKHGVIGGFKEWALVELTKGDLLDCAIVNHILGYLGYKPDPKSDWLSENLDGGHFIKSLAAYQEPCL